MKRYITQKVFSFVLGMVAGTTVLMMCRPSCQDQRTQLTSISTTRNTMTVEGKHESLHGDKFETVVRNFLRPAELDDQNEKLLSGPMNAGSNSTHVFLNHKRSLDKNNVNMDLILSRIPRNIKICSDFLRHSWRNTSQKGNCEDDYKRFYEMVTRCGGPFDLEYLQTPPSPTYDFEANYLLDPPLTHLSEIISENKSYITLLNHSSVFKVGDKVTFRLDAFNEWGEKKFKGGDEIRGWLTDDKAKAKITADVTDLNNGSYLVTAPLPWSGFVRVKIGIVYSREYLRTLMYLQRVMKSFVHVIIQFTNSKGSEATPCYHAPLLPGYRPEDICNMTSINGSPWFCGRPGRLGLTCANYSGAKEVRVHRSKVPILPLTDVEVDLVVLYNHPPRFRLVGKQIILHVTSAAQPKMADHLPWCHKVSASLTWSHPTPSSYVYNRKWVPLLCKDAKLHKSCFNNVTIVFLGDSNSRTLYNETCPHTQCTHTLKALTRAWHKSLLCEDRSANLIVRWEPHGEPMLSGEDYWTNPDSFSPSPYVIDALPSRGRHIVILSHYLHLVPSHLSAYHGMARAIAAAVRRFSARNPEARFFLLGPHTVLEGGISSHYQVCDFLRHRIEAILQDLYRDLRHRVVYFPSSDLSIACEDKETHPKEQVMIKNAMLAYMCGR